MSFLKSGARRAGCLLLGGAMLCAAGPGVRAADLPDKPIRLIGGTPPGGVPDLLSRNLAEELSKNTGRNFIVENRAGAAGLLAINAVVGAPQDGSSMVLAETGSYSIAPHLTKLNPFESNLVPVALVCTAPIFLVANASLGVGTVQELVQLAKSRPGMPYGSSGNGSSHHLAMELFKTMAGVELTHVPYRGAAQSMLSVVSGETSVTFLGMNTAVPQAQAGKIRILGVASARRSALLPDVPSIAETIPGFNVAVTLGYFTRAGTPPAVIDRLNAEFGKALQSQALRDKLAASGIEAMTQMISPAEYSALVRKEYETYGKIVQAAGLKMN